MKKKMKERNQITYAPQTVARFQNDVVAIYLKSVSQSELE